ncbi:MAG: hypothetical protein EO766_11660 [Hydrotalea sp. AMD]|uniref:hypothetical protein n=1 Tax=Hydrotalea sp. AMD TaxID=2501297 RepID=UPI0010279330|nr:hypothetical protein [Hydrotalea sp. AMD]RWZ87185.1 MAG: hypothetical protein EO766_11660 [Hydrotalea sp. AMD]
MNNPSRNICITNDFGKTIFYKAHCSCTDDKHTQTLVLDRDQDDVITLSIHSTIWSKYSYKWCDNWYEKLGVWLNSQKLKWKQVFILIFTDQIEGENEFMFHGEEQVQSYIDALQLGLEKIKR